MSWVTVASTVTSKDTLTMKLSLLGILPEDEMCELLRQELEKEGWKQNDDGTMEANVGKGLSAQLDKEGKEITVTSEKSVEVRATGTTQANAQDQLENAQQRTQKQLAEDAAAALTAAEPDVRAKLGEAIQRVYVEALRRKAASMGQVTGMQETTLPNGEREVTIKVRT